MKDIESDSGNRSHHGHDHDHAVGHDTDVRYLGLALGLILAFMVGEVIVALVSHSLALLADAGHMLTDAGAIAASLYTVRLLRRPATSAMTFGWRRAEILTAAFNGLTLLVVGVLILIEAVHRLFVPSHVHGTAVLVVAAVGVVVNLAATLVIKRASSGRMDIAGAVTHLVTDVWAFAGTFVAGLIIVLTGFDRADPIASILVVGIMAKTGWPLVRGTGRILLEATPEGVDLDVVRDHILEVPEVVAVHDLHAWTVGSDLPAVSAHVVVDNTTFVEGQAPGVLDRLQACLAGHFDVAHSTFQLELVGHADHEPNCHD
jgi:cobalt-zinc-cadmium efflux system protein